MTAPLSPALLEALRALADGKSPGEHCTAQAFAAVMRGEAVPSQIGGLLLGLRAKGETEEEVRGIVRALRDAMIRVAVPDPSRLIDTCGTGGGTISTFNISTVAAFVAAAAGAVVAKHGNRSYTSRCGSADLLEALGVRIIVDAQQAAALLRDHRLAFLFAPAFHPAMRSVTPVRRELGVPTIMNLVGPMANPAGARRQVLGVWDVSRAPLVARVLARLDAEHVLVVHARIGMDEIAPVGITDAWEVRNGAVRQLTIDPATHGLVRDDVGLLAGGTPTDNAQRVVRLLENPRSDEDGRAAVGLNAGAAIMVSGVTETMERGVELALETLDTGAGAEWLERLRHAAPASTSE